jgi:hypothetical protein
LATLCGEPPGRFRWGPLQPPGGQASPAPSSPSWPRLYAAAVREAAPDRRWKAPRVQRISCLFAGARVRRPWPRMRPRKRRTLAVVLRAVVRRSGGRRGRSRASGPSRARGNRPFTGPGPVWWDRQRFASPGERNRPHRTLQPARPRSRDVRCPSGSDRGSPRSTRPARADAASCRRRKPSGGSPESFGSSGPDP